MIKSNLLSETASFVIRTDQHQRKTFTMLDFRMEGQGFETFVSCHISHRQRNANGRGRLSTVGLLIEVACFVKKMFEISKAADLN
jgi:hypothetical protein